MFPNFTVLSTANKIRTKLLLFIDKEIQSKIKQRKLFYNPQHEKQRNTILYSNINRKYSYHISLISSSRLKEKISKNKLKLKKIGQSHQQSNLASLASPITKDIILPIKNLKNIPVYRNSISKKNFHNYFLSPSNIINIKENLYSIKKVMKPSSTFQIYKKPKTDKKYLKSLCNSLKLKKSDLLFNRQIKSKLSSVVSNINRRESSPIKKTKKKQSARIKESLNILRF